jgi:BirA family biotin operon repressor/biotin-[acetyl-CoA-carboxylase] ligase
MRAAVNAGAIQTRHIVETGSTNSDLLAQVREAQAAGHAAFPPCLLVADRQTAGRGRHGRAWHAAPGASLTFSLAWPLAVADLSGLSLAIGTALADALDPPPAPRGDIAPAHRIALKWPNDLWLVGPGRGDDAASLGRKLGGVLIETTPFGTGRVAVVGIGINVLAQAVADAASGVAWLAEIDPGATPAMALDRIVAPLVDALTRFERDGFVAFAERFAARDLLRGQRVLAGVAGDVAGIAAGISDRGELLVRTTAGTVAVGSSEVRVQLESAARDARPAEATGSPC